MLCSHTAFDLIHPTSMELNRFNWKGLENCCSTLLCFYPGTATGAMAGGLAKVGLDRSSKGKMVKPGPGDSSVEG